MARNAPRNATDIRKVTWVNATDIWKVTWVERHEHGTYRKSKTFFSQKAMEHDVRLLRNRFEQGGDQAYLQRFRWVRPVVEMTVFHAKLDWADVTNEVAA